jgi:hypothetical protein
MWLVLVVALLAWSLLAALSWQPASAVYFRFLRSKMGWVAAGFGRPAPRETFWITVAGFSFVAIGSTVLLVLSIAI